MTTREEMANMILDKINESDIVIDDVEEMQDFILKIVIAEIAKAHASGRKEAAMEILDHRYSGDVSIKGPYKDYYMKCQEIINESEK